MFAFAYRTLISLYAKQTDSVQVMPSSVVHFIL